MAKKTRPSNRSNDPKSGIEEETNSDRMVDEASDDSFPASDPPSRTPVTGVGRAPEDLRPKSQAELRAERDRDIKNSPAKQFEYGRKSEKATHHFDRTSKRLERGNPDVGDVDLGIIDETHPAAKEDNDPWTAPPDKSD